MIISAISKECLAAFAQMIKGTKWMMNADALAKYGNGDVFEVVSINYGDNPNEFGFQQVQITDAEGHWLSPDDLVKDWYCINPIEPAEKRFHVIGYVWKNRGDTYYRHVTDVTDDLAAYILRWADYKEEYALVHSAEITKEEYNILVGEVG